MRIPFIGKKVEERASFSDAVTELLLRQAIGGDSDAIQTAAAEFCIGLVGRCFASANLDPMIPAVSPGLLMDVGRRLMSRGNAVYAIQVDGRGLSLLPVSSFDVTGGVDPATWYYRCQLPGPSRQETRTLPSSSVLHVRVNVDPNQPWYGISALAHAGLSSSLIARLEKRMSEEANSRTGYLLPHRDLSPDQLAALKADLGSISGNVALIHSQAAAYDSRGQAGGSADWTPRRFGADIPAGNIQARREVAQDTVAALGVPPAMLAADTGTASQESYRQFALTTLQPLGDILAHELADKMERPGLMVRFDRVAASDVVRRSKAYQTLLDAKIEPGRAARLAGVE